MSVAALFLASALVFSQADAARALESAVALVRDCTPRDGGTAGSARAARYLSWAAKGCGASVREDRFSARTPDGTLTFVNVYAEFESVPGGDWIVLVSHFDTKPGVPCPGANDGASTSGLLVSLAGALVRADGKAGNVMLVWTDGEECRRQYGPDDGLHGSRRAVAELLRLQRRVRAVICLDMLGDCDLHVSIPANGTGSLAETVLAAARALGLSRRVSRTDMHVRDDHVPFLDAGWPAVDLIDFAYGPDNAWWHSSQDTADKLSAASLGSAGRLVLATMALLREEATAGVRKASGQERIER